MKIPGDDKEDGTEDLDLWIYVTRDVKPLPGHKIPVLSPQQEGTNRRSRKKIIEVPDLPQKAPKGREIDHRTAERVRRGQMAIEACLDLHGMSRVQANQALQSFLVRCYHEGLRHVLVITGKGARNSESRTSVPGILRQAVPQWLNERPLRDIVLRFNVAKPRDGGEGALYILLRRKR